MGLFDVPNPNETPTTSTVFKKKVNFKKDAESTTEQKSSVVEGIEEEVKKDDEKPETPVEQPVTDEHTDEEKENDNQDPPPPAKKRGRKTKYTDEDRPEKLSFVINKELALKVRKVARHKGITVILLVQPYIEEWIMNPIKLKNPYALSEKSSNGVYLDKTTKEKFIEVVAELGFKQSHMIESIYNKIVEDFEQEQE